MIIGENIYTHNHTEDDPTTIPENEEITGRSTASADSVASAVWYPRQNSQSLTSIHTSDPRLNELSPNPIIHLQALEDYPQDFE